MPRSRYETQGVEKHGGRSVVTVFDRAKGETLKVYRRGSRYLRWDARDLSVRNQAVQRVVREALEAGVS